MASPGAIPTMLGGVEANLKKILGQIFDYVLKNLRLGRPGHQERSENFQASYVEGTTAAVASAEFSIAHGRDTAPYLAIPVLSLNTVGSRVVDLEVTRAADNRRIYLKSSVTDAPVSLFLEG